MVAVTQVSGTSPQTWNNFLHGSPYPERPELREQHGDPSAEAAAGAVLLDVEVLECRDFRGDGVHVLQSYGNTQGQPGHAGGDGGCVGSERITTWKKGSHLRGPIVLFHIFWHICNVTMSGVHVRQDQSFK